MQWEGVLQEFPINLFAILAAVIIKQAIGAFWYSPALFGPSWCKLAGVSEAEMKAGLAKALIPDVIGSALMAFVLVHAVHYAGAHSSAPGAAVGFFNWLGFVAVATLGSVTFEKAVAALSDQQRQSAARAACNGRGAGGAAVMANAK